MPFSHFPFSLDLNSEEFQEFASVKRPKFNRTETVQACAKSRNFEPRKLPVTDPKIRQSYCSMTSFYAVSALSLMSTLEMEANWDFQG